MNNTPTQTSPSNTDHSAKPHRFALGQLVATPGALAAFERNSQQPIEFLTRHAGGDWGMVDEEDKQANDDAVDSCERILSAYYLKDRTKIWIITEANRAVTTVLLPEEY